jgi:hypothetical protein
MERSTERNARLALFSLASFALAVRAYDSRRFNPFTTLLLSSLAPAKRKPCRFFFGMLELVPKDTRNSTKTKNTHSDLSLDETTR